MIRNESQYENSCKQIEQIEQLIREQRKKLAAEGMRAGQIKRALDPSRVLLEQIKDELKSYERVQEGSV